MPTLGDVVQKKELVTKMSAPGGSMWWNQQQGVDDDFVDTSSHAARGSGLTVAVRPCHTSSLSSWHIILVHPFFFMTGKFGYLPRKSWSQLIRLLWKGLNSSWSSFLLKSAMRTESLTSFGKLKQGLPPTPSVWVAMNSR